MRFVYSDGGREKYFKAKKVSDCVVRAIANATSMDYKKIYNHINHLEKTIKVCKNEIGGSAREGVRPRVYKHYLEKELNFKWVSLCRIGQKEKTHLKTSELPKNKTLILRLSNHLTCVKNGILYDTYDCSREGTRIVYGYWVVK